ncbi:tag-243 [Pristionchus pacificus]|uniref:Tag-243 protein n=1 Tax=Pristionchus pacificus TaxID=54126 RepID=A0A2A6C987_PRIPA|nr:tag-243 [Pristionchus pacificus]|eukprot:PDM74772.1 tag-243 protein [Pristionchus pacificus]
MSARDAISRLNQVAAANEERLKKILTPQQKIMGDLRPDRKLKPEELDLENPRPAAWATGRVSPIWIIKRRTQDGFLSAQAGIHVCREILYLCELIDQNAEGFEPNRWIKFGKLFVIYSYYSDKLVGMLIRARKYGLLHFEGEMLYQRQDDNKNITLLYSLKDIRERMKPSGDPKNCVVVEGPPPVLPPDIRAAKEAEEAAAKQRRMSGAAGFAAISQSKGAPPRKDRRPLDPAVTVPPPPPSFCMSFVKKTD